MSDKNGAVIKHGLLDMQICVPSGWTDEAVLGFSNRENPCGTGNGWRIRRGGDPLLAGCDERVICDARCGFVHIMLDA
jgi:hypothetical protein